jgi:hypothetical protein
MLRIASYRHTEVQSELESQQKRYRLRIQPLPSAKPPESGEPRARELETPIGIITNCGIYDIGHADEAGCDVRLQRAAVPALTVGRITNAQLGAAGTYGNFGVRLGLGSSSQVAVSIALRNLQELTLNARRLAAQPLAEPV